MLQNKGNLIYHPPSYLLTRNVHLFIQVETVTLKWRLQAKVCSPLVTACVVGMGGTAEEGEGP